MFHALFPWCFTFLDWLEEKVLGKLDEDE
jgi:hypothetical protein